MKPLDKSYESAENYLETILVLSQEGKVRSVDIAKKMGYSKPSISIAMKNLKSNDHISIDAGGFITLTDSGREIAQQIYDRHTLIADWLIYLGVDKETAVQDACKMEHGMSEKSFFAIQKHINEWKQKMGCPV